MSLLTKFIKNSNDIWPFKYLVFPLFLAIFIAGPTCFVACSKDFQSVQNWFGKHEFILLSCYFWPAISLIIIRWCKEMYKKTKDAPVSEEKALMTMLHLVDSVLGNKSDRFATFAVSYSPNGDDVFHEITQPDIQIELLVRAIHSFFELIKITDDEIRVCLVEMGETNIKKILFYEPRDKAPAGKLEEYQNEQCSFSVAKRNSNLLIIEDIQKEIQKTPKQFRNKYDDRRYIEITGDPNSGSMIVFPIRHRGLKEIVYCVSVYNSQPNYFKNIYRPFYEKVLNVFTIRIELEHSLKIIKEKRKDITHA